MDEAFDYIIVGAGSAGCVVAERLSADGKARVLVLEAGGPDRSPWIALPKGVAKLVTNPKHIWAYHVTQSRFSNAPANEVWIRGKGLGGSSSVNGMIWSRGEPQDYDDWEKMGCTGWNGASMTAAFQRLEDHKLGASKLRGAGGPVRVDPHLYTYPLADRMIEAGEALGLTRTAELNDIPGGRVGLYSHNIKKGRRQSSAVTFLSKARKRRNVTIVTHALAERILFDGTRACGIEVKVKGQPRTFACRGEIIVSGGAIESPLLLQRSGIGPAERLRELGITPVADSPDVGEKFREHLSIALSYRIKEKIGTNTSFFGFGLFKAMLRYIFTRKGIMATGPFEVGGFTSVGEPDKRTDLQIYMGGYVFKLADDNHPVPLDSIDPEPGISIFGQLLRLTSEGSIRVTGPKASDAPEINPNWLTTEFDRRSAIESVRFMRKWMNQPSLRDLVDHEMVPGAEIESDEELLDAIRRLATCGLHGVGSCRMGADDRAVVDPRLRVRGVQGVRVADCSVMPGPITGNTNAPAMALGLRAAYLILEDRG